MASAARENVYAVYVLGVVALLVGLQGYAFFEQWHLGFRPLSVAPLRVPLSWDMFAVVIERCEVSWSPPSGWNGKALSSLHELAAPFEWDPVYNRRQDYINAASYACGELAPGAQAGLQRFKVRCFAAKGEETHDEFECPPLR